MRILGCSTVKSIERSFIRGQEFICDCTFVVHKNVAFLVFAPKCFFKKSLLVQRKRAIFIEQEALTDGFFE